MTFPSANRIGWQSGLRFQKAKQVLLIVLEAPELQSQLLGRCDEDERKRVATLAVSFMGWLVAVSDGVAAFACPGILFFHLPLPRPQVLAAFRLTMSCVMASWWGQLAAM